MKRGLSRLSPKLLGYVVLVLFMVVGVIAFQKEKVESLFSFGHETIHAEFAGRSKVIGDDLTYDDTVKLNGVVVGKVTTIEQTPKDTMIVGLLLEPGTKAKLGTMPSAFIEPTLATDGVQFVGLRTGGDPGQGFSGDLIPLSRTKMPVYLDDVVKDLSPARSQQGVRATIGQIDATLRQGGSDAIRTLVTDSPANLTPAGVVLTAFRGTNPQSDLSTFVTGIESFSEALNQQQGQFSSTVRSLNLTTRALAAGSPALAQAIGIGPDTLRETRAGLADLQPTLSKLQRTSDDFDPSARKLDDLLTDFGPTLHRARPVFHDLRHVLHDARPLFDRLPDTSRVGIRTLDHIRGPVFDRLNGPIKDRIYAPFVGRNEYKGGSSPIPTYKELGYFISAFSNVFKHYDANGALARLEAGAGGNSLTGTKFPMSMEQYLETLGLQRPIGPNPHNELLGKVDLDKAHPGQALPNDLTPNSAPNSGSSIPLLGGN
jgi:phospholipid/cholesterol/gamma-HCH transport system substrate-binding protein